ncbi:MAG: hypothetical protein DSM106950_12845 [Stigonema ocellatum SAG 48.90 = DSM 106950]|nr:hypothetical protein [Stigonema ocellatum SAG 48.90 = DSM 106950]
MGWRFWILRKFAPVWSRIRNYSTHWADPTSPLYEKADNIWLEFDVESPPPTVPVPSLFFGFKGIPSRISTASQSGVASHPHQWVPQSALKLLLDKSLPSLVEYQLLNCFDLLPTEAYVFQIGVMLARKSDLVRICIRNISPEQILDYLTQINWPGSVSELKAILTKLSS